MEAMVNGKADIWRRRIDNQRASGQSVRAWCEANDPQEGSFYWWRARLGLSPVKAKPSAKERRTSRLVEAKPAPLAFAQVVVHPPTAEPLGLRLAGGHELILPASMPLEQVARLVRAIEGGGEACRGTT
jgi:hypothetical protein